MTRKCAQCDSRKGMVRFKDKPFTIEHADMTMKVEGLSGWRCEACGETEFDAARPAATPLLVMPWCCATVTGKAMKSGAFAASWVSAKSLLPA